MINYSGRHTVSKESWGSLVNGLREAKGSCQGDTLPKAHSAAVWAAIVNAPHCEPLREEPYEHLLNFHEVGVPTGYF